MNYNLTCQKCKKIVKVSTRNASLFQKEKKQFYSFDCPECNEEIIAELINLRR